MVREIKAALSAVFSAGAPVSRLSALYQRTYGFLPISGRHGLLQALAVLLLPSALLFSACNSGTMQMDDSYPHTAQDFEYMGKAPRLTSNSSNKEFFDGLYEVMQEYEERHPDSSEYRFDGITYGIADQQPTCRIPDIIWELYWANLDKERYSVGYCWKFIYRQIVSEGGTGTAYILWTIVTNTNEVEVLHYAAKGVVSPYPEEAEGEGEEQVRP